MTEKYLNKKNISDENKIQFEKLIGTLTHSSNDFKKSLFNFLQQFKETEHVLQGTHRTPAWKRYASDVLSILTIVPALARAARSYTHYGTFCFWKPESRQALEAINTIFTKKEHEAILDYCKFSLRV